MAATTNPRTVKLLCPSLSKIVAFAAWDDQKLDLGSIAKAFGLEASTLKLNGHFISRGVDLISSSVTWRSLINFFSSKGFPTGKDDSDALIVDGKLCKSGTKRRYGPQDVESEVGGVCGKHEAEENKKLRGISSGYEGSESQVIGFKRKQLLKDVNLLKKLKINETKSEHGERGNNFPSSKLKCSNTSGNLKRMREDDMIIAAPCKRFR